MQKQAPTVGRLLVMVGFALSCFGLLLFLWLAFGGPIRRGAILISCNTATVLNTIIASDPRLGEIAQLTGLPQSTQICPSSTQAGGAGSTTPGSGGGGGGGGTR